MSEDNMANAGGASLSKSGSSASVGTKAAGSVTVTKARGSKSSEVREDGKFLGFVRRTGDRYEASPWKNGVSPVTAHERGGFKTQDEAVAHVRTHGVAGVL